MPTVTHKLGFGHGSLIENTDTGTVQYRPTGQLIPAFNVRIADVTGVSSLRYGLTSVRMVLHGQGTVLAEVVVNQGTTEKVDSWFRSRIGLGSTRTTQVQSPSIADELLKLGELHRTGVLTDAEFASAKDKLIK